MRTGVIIFNGSRATMTNGIWECDNNTLLRILTGSYSPRDNAMGDAETRAFNQAIIHLKGRLEKDYDPAPKLPEGAVT